jgi:hypothetical protein
MTLQELQRRWRLTNLITGGLLVATNRTSLLAGERGLVLDEARREIRRHAT